MKGLFSPFMRICLRSPPKIKGQEREYAKARKKREHIVTRFAEQGWSWLYCSVYWTFGVVSIDFRHCFCQDLIYLFPFIDRPPSKPLSNISRTTLGHVPGHPSPSTYQVLLSLPAWLVVPPAARYQLREAKKRPLADVWTPHLDHYFDCGKLCYELYPGRCPYPLSYGLLRHSLTSKSFRRFFFSFSTVSLQHHSSPKCFATSPSPPSATSHSSSSSFHGSLLDKSVSSSLSAPPISTLPNLSPLNGLPNKADFLLTGYTLALSLCSLFSGSSRPRGFIWLATSQSAWYEVWAPKIRGVMRMSLKRMRWSKCQRVWVLQPQPNLNKRRICESENDYSTRRGVYDIFLFFV